MANDNEFYFEDTPWICLTYLTTDTEADANDGESKVKFDCCICGLAKEVTIHLPTKDDPVWETMDPEKGSPEANKARLEFQQEHLHEDKHTAPMLTWAKPLRNIEALNNMGGIDLKQLKQRIIDGIQGLNN